MNDSLRRVSYALLTVLLLVCVAAGVWSIQLLYRRIDPAVHTYGMSADTPLTEAVAIEFTKRALVDDGSSTSSMIPMPYWPESQFSVGDDERLFSRNSVDNDSGYVMWSNGYTVRIKRNGERVECRVFKQK